MLRARRGFTLAEVLVSVALLAILASVTYPTIRGRIRDGYTAAIVQEFGDIATAISAYRQNVGKYPPSLDYLVTLPGTPKDFCAVDLSATAQANWRGPYLNRVISSSLPNYWLVGNDDTVQVTLGSTTGTGVQLIEIFIDGADQATANDVDRAIDGQANPSDGTLQWIVRGNGTRMQYMIPTKLGAC